MSIHISTEYFLNNICVRITFYIFSIGGRRQNEIKMAGSKGKKWFARKYLQCRWRCCTIQDDVTH